MNRFAKVIVGCLLALAYGGVAYGAGTLDSVIANETGLAYNNTYPLDISETQAISMQVTYTSTTFAASQTFTDGTQATGTLTVVSFTALSTAAASGSLTMVSTTAAAGAAGTALVQFGTNTAGARIRITGPPGDQDYTTGSEIAIGAVSSNTAANFATAVNVSSNSTGIKATAGTGVSTVTITCITNGSFCNSYAVTSSSPAEVSTAAFSGGVNPTKITIGGYAYLAGADFAVGASTSAMGVNLATVIAASSATTLVDASANAVGAKGSGVVFTTSTVTGTVGNRALASSNPLAISTSGVFMTGGQDNATFTINGRVFTANTDFYPKTSTAITATAIASAITNSSTTTGVIAAAGGTSTTVVFATSTVVGTASNFAMASSTNGALSLSTLVSSTTAGVATGIMTTGTNSGYSITTDKITIASHGFTKALPIVYSSATPAGIGGLITGTTYFVVVLDANTIGLSSTSAVAQAGNYIDLTSSATGTTAHTFTLTPIASSGPVSAIWQVSNDSSIWSNLTANTYNISVASIPASGNYTFGGGTTIWDIGPINYRAIRLNVTGPVTGGISLKASVHGKGRQ